MRFRGVIVGTVALAATAGPLAGQTTAHGWEPIVSESQERSYEAFRYAPMVRIGETLIASGVIGVGGGDNRPGAQFRRAFERMIAILEDYGLTLADVAEMTTYHVNLGEHGQEFMAIRSEFLPEPPYPAWTAIGVERLWMEQALIEIQFTAALRPQP